MNILYNFLLRLGITLLAPGIAMAGIFRSAARRAWGMRLGFLARDTRKVLLGWEGPRVWLHAASMGEINAMAPLLRIFYERNPQVHLCITTQTKTGLQHAKHCFPFAGYLGLAPLDAPGAVRRTLRLIRPNLLIVAETELWPNLTGLAKKQGSLLALINGRISERSYRRYRWIQTMVRPMLANFDLLALQTESDAQRYLELGANSQRVKIIGNMKYDHIRQPNKDELRRGLQLSAEDSVWTAGSTRPGEERRILDVWENVIRIFPKAVLVLAPRHLNRLSEIEHLLRQRQMAFARLSSQNFNPGQHRALLVDRMGVLADLYAISRIAFVGGTLQPFGGHNPLEPAIQGVPVLVGPHHEHFAADVAGLVERGGCEVVTDGSALQHAVLQAFAHPEAALERGRWARDAAFLYRGATQRTMELLEKLLLIRRWADENQTWRQESLRAEHAKPKADEEEYMLDEYLR